MWSVSWYHGLGEGGAEVDAYSLDGAVERGESMCIVMVLESTIKVFFSSRMHPASCWPHVSELYTPW